MRRWRRLPRLMSIACIQPTTAESSLPVILSANEQILTSIHTSGLPWWATLISSTVILRSVMTLPIAVYQQRSIGKMIALAPMVQSWGETLKVKIANESKHNQWSYSQYQKELQKQYSKKVKSIYAEYGCSRWKLLLLPWIQIPLFVSMSLTLRHMTAFPLPYFGQTSSLPVEGLSEGGLSWFTDLTVTDPTMILPVLIGTGNLLNVELNAWYARGKQQTTTQKTMTNAFRVLSVAFIPIAANVPMAMCLYWTTSAWYSVLQNVCFRVPGVRSLLKMPMR
ncbi:60Kd inner membrane protein-domain-containing protein [Pilobolus umbonatus]|nr:60Kd inner membrane protein-domain-containing protein [Pilobolus umbonatus]